ncbi:transcriptional regulator [Echinicola pacifica]|uniref:Transcriptional regulator n=1 Tax=Echinicola pacifica TaxID=346377 RepID=A0A918PWM3_9BACT|nr:GntR family transcriptional regulator [Echinicola pacifica]GGZ25497.1 transcriptional regulator [Echinicola pacifica]
MTTETQLFKSYINEHSRVPKYRQLATIFIEAVERGDIQVGEKLPSISELREGTGLARDTIVRAFNYLQEKKIVTSVMSKGFYVTRNVNLAKTKVLIVLNKLSSYKLKLYHLFVDALGANYQVDLRVHHCNAAYLQVILDENVLAYEHIVVMPHFSGLPDKVREVIQYFKRMPSEKLLLMDKYLPELEDSVPCIYQDFESDIYFALQDGIHKLKKYEKVTLVFPENPVYPYPQEIKNGFIRFCEAINCQYEVIDRIYEDMEFRPQDAYIIIDEEDLISFLQQARDGAIDLGNGLGVISYNDTPLKEVLGISVMTTDFEVMADSAAYMIKKKKCEAVQNFFSFIDRGSI